MAAKLCVCLELREHVDIFTVDRGVA
jgi:hypothetical protein